MDKHVKTNSNYDNFESNGRKLIISCEDLIQQWMYEQIIKCDDEMKSN